jgi:hypothetical protein
VSQELLADAVRALSSARDADQALSAVAALLVGGSADWCVADRIDPPDVVTRIAALGPAGALDLPGEVGGPRARRSSAQAIGLLGRLADAPGQLLHLGPADLASMAGSSDPRLRVQATMAQGLGTTDLLVIGLSNRDVLLGVLALGRTGGTYGPDEVDALVDLARLAGLALGGQRLHEVQRDVSAALQQSLLPQLPVLPGLTLAARFVPAGEGLSVGGDWYDVLVLPDGDVALVIGDATGHDVQAVARMAELRNLLRGVALDRPGSPAAVLVRLERVIARVGAELSGTCVVAQLSRPAADRPAALRWSSAGHLPLVLLRAGRAELLETAPDLMLGVQPDAPRADHGRNLLAGDVLVLFTDGLVEDRLTAVDVGLGALLALVEQAGDRGPEVLADVLVARLAGATDDAAVLVVRLDC